MLSKKVSLVGIYIPLLQETPQPLVESVSTISQERLDQLLADIKAKDKLIEQQAKTVEQQANIIKDLQEENHQLQLDLKNKEDIIRQLHLRHNRLQLFSYASLSLLVPPLLRYLTYLLILKKPKKQQQAETTQTA